MALFVHRVVRKDCRDLVVNHGQSVNVAVAVGGKRQVIVVVPRVDVVAPGGPVVGAGAPPV